jgi:hypothetical protein
MLRSSWPAGDAICEIWFLQQVRQSYNGESLFTATKVLRNNILAPSELAAQRFRALICCCCSNVEKVKVRFAGRYLQHRDPGL